ncbi:S-adenosyl-L-methionine-dependent methyltransferase [Lophiotrema nucula]|uniref:S-adenosyl-L-methionine-dependent methyltransferase n=1 Tax=Lophiotrema nucula TaxID=690887 RepID=A0A6A5ZVH4_9PLEO|nr:S-adenosyl-L-methionine-dependent methyltransferase [Lophiotrema nucula]
MSHNPSLPIYDRPTFFNNYLTLPRSQKGLDGAPGWPKLREMVGDVAAETVLDLGCGLGWFSRYAAQSGAASVIASDISNRMIERAKEMTAQEAFGTKIEYGVKDLNDGLGADGGKEKYDLVYSSLALHYLPNESVARLLKEIFASIKPGGRFVFSIEHPIFTSPSNPVPTTLPDGREIWPFDSYGNESIRETSWMGGVTKYHRTMQTYLKSLIDAGFVLKDLVEWLASGVDVNTMFPEWSIEKERPMFLLVKVEKPSSGH